MADVAAERERVVVRTTIDLDPATYRVVKQWALDEDVKLVDVYRALLHRLLTDDQVARKVRRDLEPKRMRPKE